MLKTSQPICILIIPGKNLPLSLYTYQTVQDSLYKHTLFGSVFQSQDMLSY